MTEKRLCEIPARTLPPCDMEWGHEGDLHANAGDGFYARDYQEEHHRRQREMRAARSSKEPLTRFPLLVCIAEPNQSRCAAIYRDNREAFESAPGSRRNHQAWPGGYIDHVEETMQIASDLWETLNTRRSLPFTLSDALLVMYLHDIEKPFRSLHSWSKAARARVREDLIRDYGIELTASQQNAILFVEGEGDLYSSEQRIMNELAAFCHCCDVISARMWHDEPKRPVLP